MLNLKNIEEGIEVIEVREGFTYGRGYEYRIDNLIFSTDYQKNLYINSKKTKIKLSRKNKYLFASIVASVLIDDYNYIVEV